MDLNLNDRNFIIVEGPDCSGKSTLVKHIKNMLHWDSKSLHHIKGNQFNRYLKEYSNNLNTVYDRSHISEMVYSRLWRDGSPFSKREEKILKDIITTKAIVIFACPKFEILKVRYDNRKFEQSITINELEISHKFFLDEMSVIPHIYYESKDEDELNEVLKKIKEILK